MRLADFILSHVEQILGEWEIFARSIWKGAAADPLTLRDHAGAILRAAAKDMVSLQSRAEQAEKSKGEGGESGTAAVINRASVEHGADRLRSGFDLLTLVSEYRALRASVIRQWRDSCPQPDRRDLDDITRFNEAIDQSLAEAAESFAETGERSREMFLAILGHDLRNPLNSILLSAQVLSMTGTLGTDERDIARQITASGTAMAQIITDLLDFTATRLGGSMPMSPAPVDLEKVCDEVVDEIRSGHPAHVVRLETRGDLRVEADAPRLRQVLSNLLGNAIQHGDAGTPIVVTAQGDEADILVTVHNGGRPIPPEAQEAIFDPLVRGPSREAPGRRRPGSIGLGLYIAREIMTAHGGTIEVKSSADAGTTFSVRLPRRRASHCSVTEVTSPPASAVTG